MSTSIRLSKIKAESQAREEEERRIRDRKRAVIILAQQFLLNHGYARSAELVGAETSIPLTKFEPADNMDLEVVMHDYEEYFEMRFGKKPKLFRRIARDEDQVYSRSSLLAKDVRGPGEAKPSIRAGSGDASVDSVEGRIASSGMTGKGKKTKKKPPLARGASSDGIEEHRAGGAPVDSKTIKKGKKADHSSSLSLDGKTISVRSESPSTRSARSDASSVDDDRKGYGRDTPAEDYFESRILKPMPSFPIELRGLAHTISQDIIINNPSVRWDDIAGCEDAKQLLKEAVVFPIRYPELFQGSKIMTPWKGVLLFGPPGTGKTMLAKAVATECRTTFFNISASSIVSKWRGDSEKLIRVLFELARYHAPSTIFLDELDSIMSHRGGSESGSGDEHEGSRRMKTELLIQMDGLARTDDLVFVLAASNIPWDLDIAVRRRLEKRILVPLPNRVARKMILESHLKERCISHGADFDALSDRTDGYSGADLVLVCKEALMRPVRRAMIELEKADALGKPIPSGQITLGEVSMEDIEGALAATRPSSKESARYVKWQNEFGSVM